MKTFNFNFKDQQANHLVLCIKTKLNLKGTPMIMERVCLEPHLSKASDESNLITNENTIIGNTVLYGATSGNLTGQAGEDLQ